MMVLIAGFLGYFGKFFIMFVFESVLVLLIGRKKEFSRRADVYLFDHIMSS